MKTFFFTNSMRNVTVALLDVFNNLQVHRFNTSGTLVKVIPVPISFGPMDKPHMFQKVRESGKKYYMPVPKMSLKLTSHQRDPDRVVAPHEFRDIFDDTISEAQLEQFITSFQPTPVNLYYDLTIRTESLADYSQIVENIQPYFNPSVQLRVKEGFTTLNWERNIQVILNDDINLNYQDPMSEEDFRFIEGVLSLTAKAWMYKGPDDNSEIVKIIKTVYQISNDTSVEIFSTSGLPSSATAPTSYDFVDYIDGATNAYTDIYDLETSGTSGSPLLIP